MKNNKATLKSRTVPSIFAGVDITTKQSTSNKSTTSHKADTNNRTDYSYTSTTETITEYLKNAENNLVDPKIEPEESEHIKIELSSLCDDPLASDWSK